MRKSLMYHVRLEICAWFMRLREFWAVWLGLNVDNISPSCCPLWVQIQSYKSYQADVIIEQKWQYYVVFVRQKWNKETFASEIMNFMSIVMRSFSERKIQRISYRKPSIHGNMDDSCSFNACSVNWLTKSSCKFNVKNSYCFHHNFFLILVTKP